MASTSAHAPAHVAASARALPGWLARINTSWHERALQLYMVIVLAHWAEHLVQAVQIYALGWARPDSRGILGQFYPWMVKSEALHYGYAIVMLIGLWILRHGFTGKSKMWWMIAFWIQFWHHIEHAVLQGQAIVGQNLGGGPVPMSFVQFVIPRVELHLIYNSIVFIPMVIAMYYHMFPSEKDARGMQCSCEFRPRKKASKNEAA